MAGLIKHAKAYTAITNPLVNSYKRLSTGFEAPNAIAWSEQNRTPMIRVPNSHGKSKRLEVRSVDPRANPYLALAVLLQAGLDGIKNNLEVPEAKNHNMYDLTRNEMYKEGIDILPTSLKEALDEMTESEVVKDALGTHIFNNFLNLKTVEWEEFSFVVTDWEKEKYLKMY